MESIVSLSFSGGLDISRYPEIAQRFHDCPPGGDCVIVDLSAAKWIDSIFMTELLLFYRKNLKLNRAMIVVARGGIGRMLTIAGLAKRIRIVSDYHEAKAVAPGAMRRTRRVVGPPVDFQLNGSEDRGLGGDNVD